MAKEVTGPEPFAPFLEFEYPRIYRQLQLTWGYSHCREILLHLLSDSTDGDRPREGFQPHIGEELVELLNRHDKAYPQYEDKNESIVPQSVFNGMPTTRPRKEKPHERAWWVDGLIVIGISCLIIFLVIQRIHNV
jgi:hypothetical protein